MFTGIIESLGKVETIRSEAGNIHFTISSPISHELKIDQSISHNGVCLTVVAQVDDKHTVTAIQETLDKSSLGELREGDTVNLERAMKIGDRLDGHMVQGHVDATASCIEAVETDGSWRYSFAYPASGRSLLVEKGSICLDGVSLTLVDVTNEKFSVAIIPYTHEHTRFSEYREGSTVNLEYDIIGKYVQRMQQVAQTT